MKIPTLLLAACTLLPSTAAAGDTLELVFYGQLNWIHDMGTLPCPVCSWQVGDPYVLSVIVDSQTISNQGNVYTIHEASITVRDQTFTTWSTELSIGADGNYDIMYFDGWIPYEWLPYGEVTFYFYAILPSGSTDDFGDFNCTDFAALLSTASQTVGGVFHPVDEGAFGPFTLYSCQALPCQAWRNCPADFNCDGGIDGTDVQAFFETWEAGNSEADLNRDGATGPSDIEFFFVRWEPNDC